MSRRAGLLAILAGLSLTACQTFYQNYPAQPEYRAQARTFIPKKIIPAPGCRIDSIWVDSMPGYTMGKAEVLILLDAWNLLDYQVFIERDSLSQMLVDRPFAEDPFTNTWYRTYFLYSLPATGFWIQLKVVNLFPDDPGIWDGYEIVLEYLPEEK